MRKMNGVMGRHSDVMNARPESDESKQRLVDELKRRGNMAFKAVRFVLISQKCRRRNDNNTVTPNRNRWRKHVNCIQKLFITMAKSWRCTEIVARCT